jgi:hypothetical protein
VVGGHHARHRDAVPLGDAAGAIEQTVRFWASEEAILTQLYGAAAVDPAALSLVERQRADRRDEFQRLLAAMRRSGRLRSGVTPRHALATVLMLTSFETYVELRRLAGLSERDVVRQLAGAFDRLVA